MSAVTGTGPAYLSGYRCIAERCEDDCCHGWQVMLDREGYLALHRAMSEHSPEEAAFFRRVAHRNAKADPLEEEVFYGYVPPDEDGRCPFLLSDGLCRIVRDHGFSCWSYTCSIYPRRLNRIEGRVEVTGFLSCPEMARLCLLDPDATTRVIDGVELPRQQLFPYRDFSPSQALRPYRRHFFAVREVLLALSSSSRSLTEKLHLLAALGDRLSRWFTAETADEAFSEARLKELLARFREPAFQEEILAARTGLRVAPHPALMLVDALLHPKFTALGSIHPGWPAAPDRLLRRYRKGLKLWSQPDHQARVTLYFENFLRNALLANPYDGYPEVGEFLRECIVRMAALRLLLFTHPRLLAGTGSRDTLDEVAVAVFHRFNRLTEQRKARLPGLEKVVKHLRKSGRDPVGALIAFE